MAVGVGIDETWVDQPVGGIDDNGVSRGGEAGRADLGDGVAGDQDVGWRCTVAFDVEQPPVADHRHGLGCHGFTSLGLPGSRLRPSACRMPGDQGPAIGARIVLAIKSTLAATEQLAKLRDRRSGQT